MMQEVSRGHSKVSDHDPRTESKIKDRTSICVLSGDVEGVAEMLNAHIEGSKRNLREKV